MQPWIPSAMNGAGRVYHHVDATGETAPPTGPVLLSANHANSLLDAAMVAMAARRPVRFLAKSTLFDDPTLAPPIRWLACASGAIPVIAGVADGASATLKTLILAKRIDAIVSSTGAGPVDTQPAAR